MLGPDGQKALAPSGATIVGQEFVRDPVAFGHVAQSLLDVLPVKQHASTEYAYLRQTTPTSNAAVVAEGATKPTSIYSVTRIEGALVVVAHLSEGIPRFWLLDNSALETFARTNCSTACRWRWRPRCSQMSTAPAGFRPKRTAPRC